MTVPILFFFKITEITTEAKLWERESEVSYCGAVCSVMVQRSASTSVWGTTVLPLYSGGMVAMLAQYVDELFITNSLPKQREKESGQNYYAVWEQGSLVLLEYSEVKLTL
jgi:hypothetical protein